MSKKKQIILQAPLVNRESRSSSDSDSPKEDKRRSKLIRLYITAIILLSMMFTVYVWQSTKMIEIKLRINRMEKDITNRENSNIDLRSEIIKLQSLTRIEEIAKNELGMIFPENHMYISLPQIK